MSWFAVVLSIALFAFVVVAWRSPTLPPDPE